MIDENENENGEIEEIEEIEENTADASDDDASTDDSSSDDSSTDDSSVNDSSGDDDIRAQSEDEESDDEGEVDDVFDAAAEADDDDANDDESSETEESTDPPEIPLDRIDKDALWVVRRLRAKGHEAYLTGGCVRDLLLDREPKDFDVATAAHPGEVKRVFRNCRLIGRRFRLAHVYFPGGKVIETATFRANPLDELEDLPDDLLVERDNVFGTIEEDARRRDLTINGLFYDPLAGKVIDYVDGRSDLEQRLIRTIGDPQIRFQEDPVRILRAIKFATRLGFDFEAATYQAMQDHAEGLLKCAPPRLQEELNRLLTSGNAALAMRLCQAVGVLDVLIPELLSALSRDLPQKETPEPEPVDVEDGAEDAEAPAPVVVEAPPPPPTPEERWERFFAVLGALDQAQARQLDMNASISFAALMLPAFEAVAASAEDPMTWFDEVTETWIERLRFTRRDRDNIRAILASQVAFEAPLRHGNSARQLVSRPFFTEALLVFTLSRHASGQSLEEVAQWKAIAAHYDRSYRQPRKGERQADRPKRPRRGRGGRSGGRRRRGGGSGSGGGGGRSS